LLDVLVLCWNGTYGQGKIIILQDLDIDLEVVPIFEL